MCKPLKGKEIEIRYSKKVRTYATLEPLYASYNGLGFHSKDIVSAVQGLHKELRDWYDIAEKSTIDAMMNKWFPDIFKEV